MMAETHRAPSQRLFGWLGKSSRDGGIGRHTGFKPLRALGS